jgi:hypothetical protein
MRAQWDPESPTMIVSARGWFRSRGLAEIDVAMAPNASTHPHDGFAGRAAPFGASASREEA